MYIFKNTIRFETPAMIISSSEYTKLVHLYVVHVYDVQKNPTWLEDVVLIHAHVLLYVYEAEKVVHVQKYEVK